jgi:ankyrin repeat protein/uncharacterized caspase-like protein
MKIKKILLSVVLILIFSRCATTVEHAIRNNDLDSLMAIISKDKSKINTRHGLGITPLHYAVSTNRLAIVKYLVSQGAEIEASDNWGETPLLAAAKFGYIHIVEYLHSQGANINARDNDNRTPLHKVGYVGNVEMAKSLVSRGANINARDNDIRTPLHIAVTMAEADMAEYLVSQGANVNTQDDSGESPLHTAVGMSYTHIAKYLISNGANIDFQNKYGKTPLHIATALGNIEMVRYLVSHGADINIEDSDGETVQELAAKLEETDISDLFSSQMQFTEKHITEKSKPYIKLQKSKLEKPTTSSGTKSLISPRPDIDFGRYLALVIGNNSYMFLPKLLTAKNDAREVAKILKYGYAFDVKLLLDAKRSDVLLALGELRRDLTERDNLLIYYAGHGWLDKEGDEGYWLPIDAQEDNTINWISNSSITTTLKAMKAKHVLILADSCYSGKLVRGIRVGPRPDGYLSGLAQKKARSVLSSGGLEPVADSGGKGNHSVFASAFLDALRENRAIMDGTQLFSKLRRRVMLNSDQTPEYSDIRKAGHEGGEFIFVRNK